MLCAMRSMFSLLTTGKNPVGMEAVLASCDARNLTSLASAPGLLSHIYVNLPLIDRV